MAGETPNTPTVGRVVLVPENPDHNNGAKVAAAIVTAVNTDTVNVRVFADNSDTPEWRTSLRQVENVEQFDTDAGEGESKLHRWCWPV
jgi:hypothetical protein